VSIEHCAGDLLPEVPADEQYHVITTSGDSGACAINAVFGEPSSHGELRCPSARQLARQYFGKPLEFLRNQLGAQRSKLDNVVSSIWAEFIVPCLDVGDGKRPMRGLSNEVRLFAGCLNASRNVAIKARARAQYEADVANGTARTEAKGILYSQLRELFTVPIGEAVWIHIAMLSDILPCGMEGFLMEDLAGQLNRITDVAGEYEYLQPCPVEDHDGCKFTALFNPLPSFDGLRYSFLFRLCGDANVKETDGSVRFGSVPPDQTGAVPTVRL